MKGMDEKFALSSLPFILKRTVSMVFSDQLGHEHILMAFPGIVSTGISLPLYKILEIMASSKVVMIDDGFDFKFFFPINDIWGWSREVVTILGGFFKLC